jgi:hypothetical protein
MRLSAFALAGVITVMACGDAGDEAGPLVCADRPVCQVDLAAATAHPQTLRDFCTREKWPSHASTGLWPACVVDPDGRLYLLWLGGSQLVDMPGWTHDAYGGPTIEASADAGDLARCRQAMNTVPLLPGEPVCGH